MRARLSRFVLVMSIACLAGCASKLQGDYRYRGEKYGKISVVMADAVASDGKKASTFKAIDWQRTFITQLKKDNLYDERSNHAVAVVVDSLTIPNVAAGVIGVSTVIEGTVTLKAPDGKMLKKFKVDSRGARKPVAEERYHRTTSEAFAELVAQDIRSSLTLNWR